MEYVKNLTENLDLKKMVLGTNERRPYFYNQYQQSVESCEGLPPLQESHLSLTVPVTPDTTENILNTYQVQRPAEKLTPYNYHAKVVSP